MSEKPDDSRERAAALPSTEPTDEQVNKLQELLNCEPDPDETEGWEWDVCERLLTEVLRAAATQQEEK